MLAYARAISFVCSSSDDSPNAIYAPVPRLEFIYRMQRAHPGVSLHHLIQQSLTQAESDVKFQKDHGYESSLLVDQGTALATLAHQCRPGASKSLQQGDIEALKRLQAVTEAYANRALKNLAAKCPATLRAWFGNISSDTTRFTVVTLGYSGAVIEVMESCIAQSREQPPIFVLSSEDDPGIDAKAMSHELRGRLGREWRIRTAGASALASFFSPADGVLVLLGTEAYDLEKRLVAHPRVRCRDVENLRDELGRRGALVRIVFVGEGYKAFEGLRKRHGELFAGNLDAVELMPLRDDDSLYRDILPQD